MGRLKVRSYNIPIYRAKKRYSDEYVFGILDFNNAHNYFHIIDEMRVNHTIDKSTIAIHFPDMTDSEDNKLFASLSEDGKGGDILITENSEERYDLWNEFEFGETVAIFKNMQGLKFTNWQVDFDTYDESIYSKKFTRVIGIQK